MRISLPNEIILEIFLYLPITELPPIFVTCTKFHQILSSPIFWTQKCKYHPQITKYLEQTNIQLHNIPNPKNLYLSFLSIRNFTRKHDSETQTLEIKRNDIPPPNTSLICTLTPESVITIEGNQTNDIIINPNVGQTGLSIHYGKYRFGKWYFEMDLKKLNYACSIGFCDPSMRLNVDSEYEKGFIGMYNGGGGGGNPNFCAMGRRLKTTWNSRGMSEGDSMGVYVDFENYKVIGYFKIGSSRKAFFVCDILNQNHCRDMMKENEIKEEEEMVEWLENIRVKKELVLSACIWLYRDGDQCEFRFPELVDEKFRKSFELSEKDDSLFKDFKETIKFEKDFF